MTDEEQSRWERTYKLWVWIYNGFAIAMVFIPLLAFLLSDRGHATIWIEATGVWVFACYWVVKTIELLHVCRIESRAG